MSVLSLLVLSDARAETGISLMVNAFEFVCVKSSLVNNGVFSVVAGELFEERKLLVIELNTVLLKNEFIEAWLTFNWEKGANSQDDKWTEPDKSSTPEVASRVVHAA